MLWPILSNGASENYGFDATNVWALGYSNGANIAASLFFLRPKTLIGAVLLRAMTPLQDDLPDLSGKQILLLAGEFDSLVTTEDIQNLEHRFKAAGADVRLNLADADHRPTNADIETAQNWLRGARVKKSHTAQFLRLSTHNPQPATHHSQPAKMFFDFSQLQTRDAYKLLAGSVVPRPIALVTSRNDDGLVNAAPYSFFNAIGSDPALVVLGIGDRAPGVGKDSARNIRARGEFVVNLVAKNMAAQMNICAVDFPPDVSEIEVAGLELADSKLIEIPRLAASPVSLECREHTTLNIGRNRIILGEVLGIWIEDKFVDAAKYYVDSVGLELIGRMGGAGGYTETGQPFEIARFSYDEWRERENNHEHHD